MYVGLDIGGTNARASLYNAQWNTLSTARASTRARPSPQELAQLIAALIADLNAPSPILSVGVGLAAQLDRTGELVVNSPNLGWRDEPFAQILRDTLKIERVKVVNDLSAVLWGEVIGGAAQGARDVLAVYVGTGVGGGILYDGKMFDGAGGKAGEIGHLKVYPGGRLCGCGERGCAEAYAGGVHLEEMVEGVAARHELATLLKPDGRGDLAAADALVASSAAPEELVQIWERAAQVVAHVIGHAATLLNPALLLLGGGVLHNCAHLRALTLEQIPAYVSRPAAADLHVKLGVLDDLAGMLGAASLATQVE